MNIYKAEFGFIDDRLVNKLDFKFIAPENLINFNFPSNITNLFQTIFLPLLFAGCWLTLSWSCGIIKFFIHLILFHMHDIIPKNVTLIC